MFITREWFRGWQIFIVIGFLVFIGYKCGERIYDNSNNFLYKIKTTSFFRTNNPSDFFLKSKYKMEHLHNQAKSLVFNCPVKPLIFGAIDEFFYNEMDWSSPPFFYPLQATVYNADLRDYVNSALSSNSYIIVDPDMIKNWPLLNELQIGYRVPLSEIGYILIGKSPPVDFCRREVF